MAALGQIQYGQPPVSQGGARLEPNPFTVRAAMPQEQRHAAGSFGACARTNDTGYATHARQSSAAAARCTASHRAAVRLGCVLELQRHGYTRRPTIAGTTGKMAQQPRAARQVLLSRRRQLLEGPAVGG